MRLTVTKQNHTQFYSMLLLMVSLAFYLFFAIFDGAVICVDSPGYIEMNIAREPIYPMFLAFFRWIFSGCGPDFYLTFAVFVQSILAAVAAWSLTLYLTEEFHLNRLISFCTLLLSFAVSLLCRFAAQRGSMYSNSILTEGITISCYLLFFRYLLAYALKPAGKTLFLCCVFVFLLISTRKQMIFSLFMLIICLLLTYWQKKQLLKGLLYSLLCTVCILLCNTLLDAGYNYVLRGEATRHSSDTRFITTMAFYTADREDARYIEDPEIRQLFEEIYDICEKNGYLKSAAGAGWLNRVSHFGDYYDSIQIDTMWPLVNAFALEHYGDHVVALNTSADVIMNTINYSVIPHNVLKIIGTFTDNFFSGLITTVAQRKPILILYSLLIYLLYLALFIYHVRVTKDKGILLFSLLTLISVLLNVGLVSMVIFCQTRYTIYNMALFYISLLLMISRLFTAKSDRGLQNPFLEH